MKQLLLVLLLGLLISTNSKSQTINDTISIVPTFKGHLFYHQNKEIKPKDLSLLMENHEEAFDLFESSREAYFFGNLFAILGTGLIVFPFAANAADHEVSWGYAFTGAGFLGLTIPIFRNYNKKSDEAIRLFNMQLQSPQTPKTSLKIGASNNGIGMTLNF